MCAYDPLQRNARLWNDSDCILNESLIGTVMMHENLVYLNSCNAIVQRDCSKLNGKVRIISGGNLIDGPKYAGFVGPGMLTAAVLGLHTIISSGPTKDEILEVIKHVAKDEQNRINGILLLVHDCVEYFLNFLSAKNEAELQGIPIKMLLVRDEISDKLNQKPLSPRSPSGILLFYKIAGAMSEEGKSLEEIYQTCDSIIKNKIIFSVGIYIVDDVSKEAAKIEISRGDRLSDSNIRRLPLATTCTNKIVESIINDLINTDNYQEFPRGSKLTLLLDYFGGFSELEANIVIKELVQQLNEFQFQVEIILMGSFRVSVELNGFHLSVLNVSKNSKFLDYLKASTLAFSWPKTISRNTYIQIDTKYNKANMDNKNIDIKIELNHEKVASVDLKSFDTDVLLKAIEYACDALINCAKIIDVLDKSLIDQNHIKVDKYGTQLAKTAETIKTTICEKKLTDFNLSNIIFQIALIFKQSKQDFLSKFYADFFNIIGKSIESKEHIQAEDWLNAFTNAIDSIKNSIKNTEFLNMLLVAKTTFSDTYKMTKNVNVIHALERAVGAAGKELELPDKIPESILKKDHRFPTIAAAHALLIWMRGAYEGVKLKYSLQKFRNKRTGSNDLNSDEVVIVPKIQKL